MRAYVDGSDLSTPRHADWHCEGFNLRCCGIAAFCSDRRLPERDGHRLLGQDRATDKPRLDQQRRQVRIIADVAIDAVVQSGFIVSLVEGDAVSRKPRRQGEQAD